LLGRHRGSGANWLWRAVVLVLGEHPVSRLGQMARDGDSSASMTLARLQPLEQFAHMPVFGPAQSNRAVSGLDEGPFEIQIDKSRCAA
jgi:hypothetical protein